MRADDQRPRFGARGRAGLRAKLEAELPRRYTLTAEQRALVPRLADFYVAHWREVVRWVPAETYLGIGYAAGAWAVHWPAVLADPLASAAWLDAQAEAYADAARAAIAADAARFPTLDAWLEAERRGELADAGRYEPDAARLLPDEVGRKLAADAHARRARWPRLCRGCGREFRPDATGRVRCDACVPSAKRAKQSQSARASGAPSTRPAPRPRGPSAAASTAPTYAREENEPDPATAEARAVVDYWAGYTSGGLSVNYRDDDPRSPVNRLAALVAHVAQLGRTDVAAQLRRVLDEARATTQRRRAERAGAGIQL